MLDFDEGNETDEVPAPKRLRLSQLRKKSDDELDELPDAQTALKMALSSSSPAKARKAPTRHRVIVEQEEDEDDVDDDY